MLDAFFELELAAAFWAKELGDRKGTAPFGQRVKALATSSALGGAAKKGQAKYVRGLPERCAEILRVRNAVAHSRTVEGNRDGDSIGLFETLEAALGDGLSVALTIKQIEEAASDARTIASHLRNFLAQNQRDESSR